MYLLLTYILFNYSRGAALKTYWMKSSLRESQKAYSVKKPTVSVGFFLWSTLPGAVIDKIIE